MVYVVDKATGEVLYETSSDVMARGFIKWYSTCHNRHEDEFEACRP